ncbi:MAG: methyltransferase [Caulobacterales bacterium]
MRGFIVVLAFGLFAASCATAPEPTSAPQAPAPSEAQIRIAAAIADPNRPQGDIDRDSARHPDIMLAFAQIESGQRVADLLPGGGYFTRLFSQAVGPQGHVYAVISPQQAANTASPPAVNAIAADPNYANVSVVATAFASFEVSEPLDLVWTAQNYHDLHLALLNTDVAAVNRAIFNALKPGGLYVIIDHTAAAGSPVGVADTLHRIDPAIVRREVEAAGFVFDAEDNSLDNPADTLQLNVFDPAIRGHTDQFAMRFRKPR